MRNNRLNYDVAVIGSGMAGLAYVLSLDPKLKVGIFTKGNSIGGASSWAQGGLAAVVTADDSISDHVADTLNAGRGLCNKEAVETIVAAGYDGVKWLEEMGVPFSRRNEGELDLGKEGGHQKRRIVHVTDSTGAAIIETLTQKIEDLDNVTIHKNELAVDLIVNDNQINGFYSLNRNTNSVTTVAASTVVLATGGVGKVYRYTTNPDESTGDGIAMAYRANCQVANMEFVQFHPTTLFHPHAKSVLISEVCRGEGAVLVDKNKNRFMPSYHKDTDLAPRDIVAHAIDAEIKKTGEDCMYLDFSPIDEKVITARFPTIKQRCLELGVDICKDLVPVVPSAHYLCGGIVTDCAGVTDIEGLYAIGETAYTGLHGANRLASNSLLECIVVAQFAAKQTNENFTRLVNEPPLWDESRVGPAHEEVMVAHNWDEIRRMMWNYVGIVRSDERLSRARRRLELIAEEVNEHYKKFVVSSDFVELRNILMCAQLIINSAFNRRESRGLHYNLDCPKQLDERSPTILAKNSQVANSIIENILNAN